MSIRNLLEAGKLCKLHKIDDDQDIETCQHDVISYKFGVSDLTCCLCVPGTKRVSRNRTEVKMTTHILEMFI